MSGAVRTTPVKIAFGGRVHSSRGSSGTNTSSSSSTQPSKTIRIPRRSMPASSVTRNVDKLKKEGGVCSEEVTARGRTTREARRSVPASQPLARQDKPVVTSATQSSRVGALTKQVTNSTAATTSTATIRSDVPNTTARSGRGTLGAVPSRGFRELQKSELLLREENEKLTTAANKTATKLRSLKQDRDQFRASVERLQGELERRDETSNKEIESLKNECASKRAEEVEEMRQLRQSMDERESELETQLADYKRRNEELEKFIEKLGINAVTLESFTGSDKENEIVVELEESLGNILINLDKRSPLMNENLARAKKLLATV